MATLKIETDLDALLKVMETWTPMVPPVFSDLCASAMLHAGTLATPNYPKGSFLDEMGEMQQVGFGFARDYCLGISVPHPVIQQRIIRSIRDALIARRAAFVKAHPPVKGWMGWGSVGKDD